MTGDSARMIEHNDPIKAILGTDGPSALAVITDLTGPFYRPIGAMMAIIPDQGTVGSLSSGCVEADIALNAQDALSSGQPRHLRYGVGSNAMDIKLPCGGGMGVMVLPNPDLSVLRNLQSKRDARMACCLMVDRSTGVMDVQTGDPVAVTNEQLLVPFPPSLRIITLGDGPEAGCFSILCAAAGYDHILLSDNLALKSQAVAAGSHWQHFSGSDLPADVDIDARTAVILFYHDHDREPSILSQALKTPAFYIGAQGSLKARDARIASLLALGVDEPSLKRLSGPIGLIPSARDPQTLAISVLADVVARASSAIA